MQLTRAEILERLKEILISSDAVSPEICDACNEDSDLFTDIGLSSIGMLYVVIAIEEAFESALKDNKLEPVCEPSVSIKDISKDGVTYIFKIITKYFKSLINIFLIIFYKII